MSNAVFFPQCHSFRLYCSIYALIARCIEICSGFGRLRTQPLCRPTHVARPGLLSSSIAFNRWLVRSYPGGVGATQANHSRVITLAVPTTTKILENAGR